MPYKNKEDERANKKEYYRKNKEKIDKKCKEYHKNNPEYQKQWHINHRESELRKNKEWYVENRDTELKRCKEWKKNNPESSKRINSRYIRTEKGKVAKQRSESKRRARGRLLLNTLTAEEWMTILKKYKFKCAYCGCKFYLSNEATKDHLIPISKGGHNTKGNIVPACRSCNSKKKDSLL